MEPEVIEVGERDLQIGDVVISWKHRVDGWQLDKLSPFTISEIDASGYYYKSDWGEARRTFYKFNTGVELFKIRRGTTQAASTSSPKKIADWPICCPECGRPQSAVLLFQSYDCKHGCYK